MSTVTHQIEDRAGSEVDDLRARVEALEQEVEQLEGREEELEAEAVRQKGDGDVDPELRHDLSEVRSDREIAETALEVKRSQLRAAEEDAVWADARDRLRQIKKKGGGLAGELPRRVEDARELAAKLKRQLEWLAYAPFHRTLWRAEARILADRFDLEAPELKDFPEDPIEVLREAKASVRGISEPRRSLGVGLVDNPGKLLHLLDSVFDEESPTGHLLARLEELDDGGEKV